MRFHINKCHAIESNDKFRKNRKDDKIQHVHNNSSRQHPSLYKGGTKFHTYFQTHRQQILCDVCTAIDVTKISQENLCCLNTTIILLVFSHIHGALADDVAYLKAKEKEYEANMDVPGVGEITVLLGAIIGSGLGFLWFNAPPAMVFMGDTGSLSLGGVIGVTASASRHELVLVIIGGLFVLETVSVIVQILSFKLTPFVCICICVYLQFQEKLDNSSKNFITCLL